MRSFYRSSSLACNRLRPGGRMLWFNCFLFELICFDVFYLYPFILDLFPHLNLCLMRKSCFDCLCYLPCQVSVGQQLILFVWTCPSLGFLCLCLPFLSFCQGPSCQVSRECLVNVPPCYPILSCYLVIFIYIVTCWTCLVRKDSYEYLYIDYWSVPLSFHHH